MRTIKLCKGAGNGVDTACLMTAANMIQGRGDLGDRAGSCICPVLRGFIVTTNDAMPDDVRSRLYSPLIWELPGTKADVETEVRRAFCFADAAVREFAPLGLESVGLENLAAELRALPEITCVESTKAAEAAAAKAAKAAKVAWAAEEAGAAAAKAAEAAWAAAMWAKAVEAEVAAALSAEATTKAVEAAEAAAEDAEAWGLCPVEIRRVMAIDKAATKSAEAWDLCPVVIRRAMAIGDKRPVEIVLTPDQLAERLN